jgi:hypothetical protein
MSTEHTPAGVALRFREEQSYIEGYTRFLETKSIIHDQLIGELNRILRSVGLELMPTRKYDRTAEPYSPMEQGALLAAICNLDPQVEDAITAYKQRLESLPCLDLDGPAGPYHDQLGEWIDYMMSHLPQEVDGRDVSQLIERTIAEYEASNPGDADDEDRIPPEALRVLLAAAIDHVEDIRVRQRVDAMIYVRERFDELEVLCRAARPDTELNLFRQAFVLLMTAFDAAVFDIVRIAFRRKFFPLIGVFGKRDKLSFEQLSETGSFEALRDELIDEQLKKRYLKDLLGLLQAVGVTLVDKNAGDLHVQLIEMVLRRNIHVHNRGVVDERYLEADSTSKKPKYSLYRLKLGEVACIDQAYLETAHRLCRNCVDQLVDWARE